MAQWGNTDDAANSVSWAIDMIKANNGNTSATQTTLFGNTTASGIITNQTVGQFGVDGNEITAARAEASGDRPAHSGWVLRTVGSGGRAGRITNEVLVAMNTIGTDNEDAVFEDYFITITTSPSDASGNSTADDQVVFTGAATIQPTTGTLTYQWEYTTEVGNTNSFSNADVAGFSGGTTTSLTVDANTISDQTQVRLVVSATGADSKTTDAATLTVTA